MHQPNSKAINKSQNSFIETSHLSIHKDNVSLNEKESSKLKPTQLQIAPNSTKKSALTTQWV